MLRSGFGTGVREAATDDRSEGFRRGPGGRLGAPSGGLGRGRSGARSEGPIPAVGTPAQACVGGGGRPSLRAGRSPGAGRPKAPSGPARIARVRAVERHRRDRLGSHGRPAGNRRAALRSKGRSPVDALPGRCPATPFLDRVPDPTEDRADLAAQEKQGKDGDDGDEGKDQGVLRQSLTFIVETGRDDPRADKIEHRYVVLLSPRVPRLSGGTRAASLGSLRSDRCRGVG